jgi:3-oxoacyl-[acyl-carrier-protein] synthase-3
MKFNNVTIKGTGSHLPEKVLTNSKIAEHVNTTDEWIYNSLGIKERRVITNEDVSDLGTKAAVKALADAGVDKEDIDLIIVATSSPERISPATACTIHQKLKIKKDVPAFDINAVCSGFVFALSMAAPLVSSRMYKNILIIGTEAYSKMTDYSDRTCVFFGDGAGAVVLGPSKTGWMQFELQSNGGGTGPTGFNCPLDAPYETVPSQVWDQAMKVLPISIKSILKNSSLSPEDISMVIPHQASLNMLKQIALKVGIPAEKVKTVMHKYGNIAGASIPIALDDARRNEEIKRGDTLLLTAIGSGWSWGSVVLKYE